MCYLDLKRFDQALFEFRAGLEALNTGPPAGREHEDMAPHRGFALMYLGHALTWAERNARLNEALKYCLKAKAAFAGKQGAAEETDDDLRAALHEVTGWVQFRRGELHQAEAELAAALGLTEDATCQYRLAACLALRAAKSKDEDERAEVIGRARLHASLARAIVSASGGPPWLASELDHVEESLKALGAAARSEPVRP
jgi:tetratricopeptide (TPR) repeat protein